jgi:hypothetical protein
MSARALSPRGMTRMKPRSTRRCRSSESWRLAPRVLRRAGTLRVGPLAAQKAGRVVRLAALFTRRCSLLGTSAPPRCSLAALLRPPARSSRCSVRGPTCCTPDARTSDRCRANPHTAHRCRWPRPTRPRFDTRWSVGPSARELGMFRLMSWARLWLQVQLAPIGAHLPRRSAARSAQPVVQLRAPARKELGIEGSSHPILRLVQSRPHPEPGV